MLEPRGADSSILFDSATDDSARVVNLARDALSQGRISDALRAVDHVRHDVRLDDTQKVTLFLSGLHAKLALGDLRGAASYARELTNLMRVRGVVGATASFGLGDFAAARGNADQAVSYYERCGHELAAARSRAWVPWRSGLARVIGGRGEIPAATSLVEAELAEARAARATYAISFALRTYAAIAPTDDRVALLDEALELLEGAGAARLEAQIRTDLAAWILLLRPTESQQAVDHLRAAEKYARAEDLTPLLSRVRWLLERLGETPDGEVPGRMAELSAAEQRVAQLVVVGKRNREIAADLAVSVKSVEWHVSHILRKLSITSRTQLADALAQPRTR
jgi:DNA-binding CsgD family transcriptional regulator